MLQTKVLPPYRGQPLRGRAREAGSMAQGLGGGGHGSVENKMSEISRHENAKYLIRSIGIRKRGESLFREA